MLSKEEVLEIIFYCDSHKINRSDRLQELGISHWNFFNRVVIILKLRNHVHNKNR